MSEGNYTLTGTHNVTVWAEEFCRIFKGHMIMPKEQLAEFAQRERYEMPPIVDEGIMIGWFANAMQTAISLDKARRREVKEKELLGGEPDQTTGHQAGE